MSQRAQPLWGFPGGVSLEGHKSQSLQEPLARMPPPRRIVLPLQQHIGELAEPIVKVGDHVGKGQIVARADAYVSAPVHASSSGIVIEIVESPAAHVAGASDLCIVIETDGSDQWIDDLPPPLRDYQEISRTAVLERIRASGIVGLGGSAFPAAVKLASRRAIETLILNGAECEPYISCDEMLMRAHPQAVIAGARIMQHVLRARECVIALEDSAPEAWNALRDALGGDGVDGMRIERVPNRYPVGGERQLIRILIGLEVPSEGLPDDIGVICHNVGTAAAVHRAVMDGQPLISRIVTVTGRGVKQPRNLEVALGTPIAAVIAYCGDYADEVDKLIVGGPMMGLALASDEAPVVKGTNCILAAARGELPHRGVAMPCIRCGDCANACPALLLPQEIYFYAKAGDMARARAYNLFDCIECGCCAYVCPSHLPLVDYYRAAKEKIWGEDHDRHTARVAYERHESDGESV